MTCYFISASIPTNTSEPQNLTIVFCAMFKISKKYFVYRIDKYVLSVWSTTNLSVKAIWLFLSILAIWLYG